MNGRNGTWSAIETGSLIGTDHGLVVAGRPKGSYRGKRAFLTEASPQGFNPEILILDLHFVPDPEHGGNVVVWGKKIRRHQYTDVTIRGDSGGDVTVSVREVYSLTPARNRAKAKKVRAPSKTKKGRSARKVGRKR